MGDRGARLSRERDHRRRGRLVDDVREGTAKMDDPEHARERAYLELCRRMAGLRDQDPSKLRFYWGSLFVAVLVELGGVSWADVEPLWQRWRGSELEPQPSGDRRRVRHYRSRRGRRRRVRLEEPFPLPEPTGLHAPQTAP